MKCFSTLSALVALSWAYTLPTEDTTAMVVRRQEVTTMSSTFTTVITELDTFSSTIEAYSGSSDSFAQVQSSANNFISIVETSSFSVGNVTVISTQEITDMQQLVDRYNAAGDSLRSRFENKKPVFTIACHCQSTLPLINQLSTQSLTTNRIPTNFM
jgi:hypothetical protein